MVVVAVGVAVVVVVVVAVGMVVNVEVGSVVGVDVKATKTVSVGTGVAVGIGVLAVDGTGVCTAGIVFSKDAGTSSSDVCNSSQIPVPVSNRINPTSIPSTHPVLSFLSLLDFFPFLKAASGLKLLRLLDIWPDAALNRLA